MTDQPDRAVVTWSAPECPFSIDCSRNVLDDIRMAVTDAFFSLPRGGAEIGGILLGGWHEGRLTISGSAALDCEHAMGPTFTLSLRDEARLQELIRASGAAGGMAVGWYHSHTRTGILLSDTDITIHNRFFPELWQVALVVKPHTLEPMRGGFFFRGSGGIIHCSASYREFVIEPSPMQHVPRAAPMESPVQAPLRTAPAARPIFNVRAAPEAAAPPSVQIVDVEAAREVLPPPPAPVIEIFKEPARPGPEAMEAAPVSAPEAAPAADPARPAQLPLPRMFELPQESTPRWLKVLAILGIAACAGVGAYAARDTWYPPVASLWGHTSAAAAAASFGLNTTDEAGQLRIRWDANADAVRAATGAWLEISDGSLPRSIVPLDVRQLASGAFTYQRRNRRVDVAIELNQPGGGKLRQSTSYLGQDPPVPAAAASPDQPDEDRADTLQTVAFLRAQLDAERAANQKLEAELAAARSQLRKQRRRRLSSQASSPTQ